MVFKLLLIGKTDDKQLQSLIDAYIKRLKHYIKFEWESIPDLKNTKALDENQQKIKEGELILKKISPTDEVVLLDEKGSAYTSLKFAENIQKKLNSGKKRVIFVVGGPYGFSEEVYRRSDENLSLSKMTFSHQMLRLFFVEQLYRAFTILRNEPYHHQ